MKKKYNFIISIIFFSLILIALVSNKQLKAEQSFSLCLAAKSSLNSVELQGLNLKYVTIRSAIHNSDLKLCSNILKETNVNYGRKGYLWLLKQLFNNERKHIKKILITTLYKQGNRYKSLNTEAIETAIQNNAIDDSLLEDIFIDKKFCSQLTFFLSDKTSLFYKKLHDNLSSQLETFLEKVSSPASNLKNKARIVALSGGSGAASLLAPALNILELDQKLNKNEVSLALLVSHIDDGGSQFTLMQSLWEAGYGTLPPLSDQVNALFTSYASDDMTRYILGNAGRIRTDDEKSAYQFTKALIITTIMDDSIKLSPHFFTFAKDILIAMKMIDQELVNTNILKLKGASLRSLYFLGKLLQKGILKKKEARNNHPAFSLEDQSKIQKIINKMATTCGIEKGLVSICSYDILTPYVKYNEHLLFIKSKKSDKNALKIYIGKDSNNNNLYEYVKAVGISLKKDSSDNMNLSFFDKTNFNIKIPMKFHQLFELEGLKITFDNKTGLKISVKEENYTIEEDENSLELKLINDKSKKIIKFARDASGREKKFENIVTESKIDWCNLNGKEILIRSRFIMMQTHITETPNTSGIAQTGYLSPENSKVGLKSGPYNALPNDAKRSVANNDAVNLIKHLEPGDQLLIGPGSIITSILPHFSVEKLVEALIDAKQRGVEIIFIMNGTYDNETIGSDLEKIFEFIEITAKRKLEEFVSTIILTTAPSHEAETAINDYIDSNMSEYNPIIEEWLEEYLISHDISTDGLDYSKWLVKKPEAIEFLKEKYSILRKTIKQSMDLEIRQDPAQTSIASKKSYGVLTIDNNYETFLQNKGIHIIKRPLLTTIPLVDRSTGKIKYRAGYSPYQFAIVLKYIIISQLKKLEKTSKLTINQQKKLYNLQHLDVISVRKEQFLAARQLAKSKQESFETNDESLENNVVSGRLKKSA